MHHLLAPLEVSQRPAGRGSRSPFIRALTKWLHVSQALAACEEGAVRERSVESIQKVAQAMSDQG